MLTAAVGMGGGTVLIAVMAQVLPVKAIIPVHGLVQLGSNVGRAAVLFPQININLLIAFILGSLLGAFIGGNLVVSLPVSWLQASLGIFILYSIWGPTNLKLRASKFGLGLGGLITTLLTMFVGATGPLVVTLLRRFDLSAVQLVATTASCLVAQHLLKVMIFGILGFAFSEYLVLIALMVCSGFIGTLVGKQILLKVDEQRFKTVLNAILSLLALRLLYKALL